MLSLVLVLVEELVQELVQELELVLLQLLLPSPLSLPHQPLSEGKSFMKCTLLSQDTSALLADSLLGSNTVRLRHI